MKLFGRKNASTSPEAGDCRPLNDDEMNLVIGGQQIIPTTSTPPDVLNQWCNYMPDGKCPYNASPNSAYCNGCPQKTGK